MAIWFNRPSVRIRWWLLMVGFAFHAPGLWFFFGQTVPVDARRENLAAVLVTLTSIVTAAWLADDWTWVIIVWLVGHFSWGARLAWHLGQDIPRPSSP